MKPWFRRLLTYRNNRTSVFSNLTCGPNHASYGESFTLLGGKSLARAEGTILSGFPVRGGTAHHMHETGFSPLLPFFSHLLPALYDQRWRLYGFQGLSARLVRRDRAIACSAAFTTVCISVATTIGYCTGVVGVGLLKLKSSSIRGCIQFVSKYNIFNPCMGCTLTIHPRTKKKKVRPLHESIQ